MSEREKEPTLIPASFINGCHAEPEAKHLAEPKARLSWAQILRSTQNDNAGRLKMIDDIGWEYSPAAILDLFDKINKTLTSKGAIP